MTHAVILAGGLARRMGGGDKGMLRLGDTSILARIAATLRPQVGSLVLNANGDPARFAALGLPVIPDTLPDHPGPLAGILAGLEHAAGQGADWLVSVPCDTPALPRDLVAGLHRARGASGAVLGAGSGAVAVSGGRRHPVVALWPVCALPQLRRRIEGGMRAVDPVVEDLGFGEAEWPAEPFDPFLNINSPEDAARAQQVLGEVVGPNRL